MQNTRAPMPTPSAERKYFEASRKSRFIFQYRCKCKPGVWWGAAKNNTCKRCGKQVDRLPLADMMGVGWFKCHRCGRLFAGFCLGSIRSRCHNCHLEILPSFIVPGEDVGSSEDNKHHCAACYGHPPCPIVEKVRSMRQ